MNPSMKVPPKRKGNGVEVVSSESQRVSPSMKVPPKRKGNSGYRACPWVLVPLNESPSEKEGKCADSLPEFEKDDALNESPSEKEGKSVLHGSAGA